MKNIRNITRILLEVLLLVGLAAGLVIVFQSLRAAPPQESAPTATALIVDSPLTTPPTDAATPIPTPTIQPATDTPLPLPSPTQGITIAPIPLVQPAADASGTLLFLTRPTNENSQANLISVSALSLGPNGEALAEPKPTLAGLELKDHNSLYPSPDGRYLATVSEWGVIYFHDLETREALGYLPHGYPGFYGWLNDNYHALVGNYVIELPGLFEYKIPLGQYCPAGGSTAISPDGQKLIYECAWPGSGGESSRHEVRLVNVDGSDDRLLFEDNAIFLSWSPDGSTIVFLGRHGWTVIDSNGDDLRDLDFVMECPAPYDPIWSPDSQSFLLRCFSSSYGWEDPDTKKAFAVLVDLRTGRSWELLPDNARGYFDPVWSPDGRHIAFVYAFEGEQDIWVINVDGTDLHRLTHLGQSVRYPIWRRP
jgi:hypothetical protein